MNIIPILKCRDMAESLKFYTDILGFEPTGPLSKDQEVAAYISLPREGARIHLSTHPGDGVFGSAILILVNDIDRLFNQCIERGLDVSRKPNSPVSTRGR